MMVDSGCASGAAHGGKPPAYRYRLYQENQEGCASGFQEWRHSLPQKRKYGRKAGGFPLCAAPKALLLTAHCLLLTVRVSLTLWPSYCDLSASCLLRDHAL